MRKYIADNNNIINNEIDNDYNIYSYVSEPKREIKIENDIILENNKTDYDIILEKDKMDFKLIFEN